MPDWPSRPSRPRPLGLAIGEENKEGATGRKVDISSSKRRKKRLGRAELCWPAPSEAAGGIGAAGHQAFREAVPSGSLILGIPNPTVPSGPFRRVEFAPTYLALHIISLISEGNHATHKGRRDARFSTKTP